MKLHAGVSSRLVRGDSMSDVNKGGAEGSVETVEANLREELDGERKRSQELLTRLKYAQADLENYRKRAERDAREAGEAELRGLVSRLVVVLDELDLAVKHAADEAGKPELTEGVGMVRRNLENALESAGVERIDCVGKPFDPALHEAVEKIQGKSPGEDTVVEELRPGFVLRGQLLRPSMVKVELARREPAEEEEEGRE
jgi:molecular chaperone GrpE